MNNEIKEINIKIPGEILDYVDTKEHLLDLFNYITNLQQEKDNLYLDNTMLKLEKDIYKQGYEELKELICNYVNVVLHDRKVIDDYKSRCEKANNYIEKQKKKMYKSRNKIALFVLMKLENILQNGCDNDDK